MPCERFYARLIGIPSATTLVVRATRRRSNRARRRPAARRLDRGPSSALGSRGLPGRVSRPCAAICSRWSDLDRAPCLVRSIMADGLTRRQPSGSHRRAPARRRAPADAAEAVAAEAAEAEACVATQLHWDTFGFGPRSLTAAYLNITGSP